MRRSHPATISGTIPLFAVAVNYGASPIKAIMRRLTGLREAATPQTLARRDSRKTV